MNRFCLSMVTGLTSLLGILSPAIAEPTTRPFQQTEAFIPLGVYWPGECTFQEIQIPKLRWEAIEKSLTQLADQGVNAIWLTHLSATETAEFTRRAEKHGIYVVASIAELAGEVDHIRKSPDHAKLITDTLASWGDAPRPIAWGLGDEPRTSYMNEMADYVKAWRAHAPGEPLTTTVMWNDVEAAGPVGFDMLTADVYPFFSAGNPNSYGAAALSVWTSITQNVGNSSKRPWMMGQAYHEPWGPYDISAEGNIVYLPGGGPHWVMPSPAQIKWQAWASIASGGKGMFYFLYRWPIQPNTKGEPVKNLPAIVSQPTDSGAPRALVHDDGRPTEQLLAMGEAYKEIAPNVPLLSRLTLAKGREAWCDSDLTTGSSDVANLFVDPAKPDERYLVVVAGYESKAPVKVTFGPHVLGIEPIGGGDPVSLKLAAPFRTAEIPVTPGSGRIFKCRLDPQNMPSFYDDDFSTEKYKSDTLNGENSAVKRFVGGYGGWLSATDAGLGIDRANVIYDLDSILAPIDTGSVRILVYAGSSNPPESRGAFWSSSADGSTYQPLSANEFGKAVVVKNRYLKVGMTYAGSSSVMYGYLSRISLIQWKHPAAE